MGSVMTSAREEKKSRDWPWVLLALVFVVAVPVSAYFAKDATGKKASWLIAAQVAATALAFLVPQVRQIQARRREATASDRELAARTETRAATGERGYTALERLWARPSLEVLSLAAGDTGSVTRSVIPAVATASISIRTVPSRPCTQSRCDCGGSWPSTCLRPSSTS